MSFSKMDRTFPFKPQAISDAELAEIVAAALRQDFGETPSAIKRIGTLTSANLRAIKNWYEARNTPSSGHLLLLARFSPALLQFILEQIGGEDLWDAFSLLGGRVTEIEEVRKSEKNLAIYSDNSVTIKVSIAPADARDLNQRHLWFLGMLQDGQKPRAKDIARIWQVTPRTAKRDVAGLLEKNLIIFTGARKTGWYEITYAKNAR